MTDNTFLIYISWSADSSNCTRNILKCMCVERRGGGGYMKKNWGIQVLFYFIMPNLLSFCSIVFCCTTLDFWARPLLPLRYSYTHTHLPITHWNQIIKSQLHYVHYYNRESTDRKSHLPKSMVLIRSGSEALNLGRCGHPWLTKMQWIVLLLFCGRVINKRLSLK